MGRYPPTQLLRVFLLLLLPLEVQNIGYQKQKSQLTNFFTGGNIDTFFFFFLQKASVDKMKIKDEIGGRKYILSVTQTPK